MERLTGKYKDENILCCGYCDGDQCNKDDCAADCPCKCEQDAIDRLAAYEDTGLEPAEIEELDAMREITPEAEYAIDKHFDKLIDSLNALVNQADESVRVKELLAAEAEGRLLVPPCKVGDELWFEKSGVLRCETVDRVQIEQTDIDDGWCVSIYTMSVSVLAEDIGRLVWLSREAAETALKEREGA